MIDSLANPDSSRPREAHNQYAAVRNFLLNLYLTYSK